MAIRLGEYVVYGELYNTANYSTHGVIALRAREEGEETVVRLDLTGNCDPDLRGKGFRFWPEEPAASGEVFRLKEHKGFQDRQIGPTGTMTAQGWARVLPCPAEEFERRAKLGEAPPTEWKRRLYLEWYGQNGRVVVEMAGVIVEECTRPAKGTDDEGDWAPLPNPEPHPDLPPERPQPGLGIVVERLDGDKIEIEHWATPPGEDACSAGEGLEEEGLAEGAGELMPASLQKVLDEQSAAIDRAIRGESGDEDDSLIPELELMDYCIDHGDAKPMGLLLGSVEHLPPPDELGDEEIEARLKALLARMAMLGVALDVCEHFTPRDCYALLRDKILPEENAFEELIGTGWAQHVMTHEHCPRCASVESFEDI
jgi:hypothetical protein